MHRDNLQLQPNANGHSSGVQAFGLCAVVIIGPLIFGCATTDDLDAMKATMNATISANKRSLDSRIQQLENMKRKWEEQQAQLAKLTQDVAVYQDSIARLSDTVKSNAGEMYEVRQALQSEQGTITRVLDAEEALHREGLRSLQSIRRDLSAAKGRLYKGRALNSMRQEAPDDVTFDGSLLR